MTQHHLGGEDDRAGVHLILTGIFRRGAVGRLKQRTRIADVGSRRDTDTADLRGQGVGDVVAVEVHTGDDVVLRRAQQDLLQEGIGDHIFDHDGFTVTRVLHRDPRAAIDGLAAELVTRQLVAPILEGALGELHDIALMHQGHRLTIVGDGILDRGAHQALRPLLGARFHPDATVIGEADLVDPHLLAQEVNHLLRFGAVGLPFDTGVDVFGVLAEDHHIGQLRLFHRARRPLVVAYRTQTDVQV